MAYPSIITQPGSAERNVQPIAAALADLLDSREADAGGDLPLDPSPASGPDSSTSDQRASPRRILEIGSGDCTHLKRYAKRWKEVEWWPTGRDGKETRVIDDALETEALENVKKGTMLDIGIQAHWDALLQEMQRLATASGPGGAVGDVPGFFMGVLMVNIIHCCPVDYPENVFRHFSALSSRAGSQTPALDPVRGWIAAYSPFLNDDGSYKSASDEKFDREYIRAKEPSLGLRSVASISAIALRWGFQEVQRIEMPRGNVWVVWRPTQS